MSKQPSPLTCWSTLQCLPPEDVHKHCDIPQSLKHNRLTSWCHFQWSVPEGGSATLSLPAATFNVSVPLSHSNTQHLIDFMFFMNFKDDPNSLPPSATTKPPIQNSAPTLASVLCCATILSQLQLQLQSQTVPVPSPISFFSCPGTWHDSNIADYGIYNQMQEIVDKYCGKAAVDLLAFKVMGSNFLIQSCSQNQVKHLY
eukprot:jgi/Psemu1/44660/gm1.44660_g